MELFSVCHVAMSALVRVLTTSTFVTVKQMCSHYGHQQLQKSQPPRWEYTSSQLLSAAILFSEATPDCQITCEQPALVTDFQSPPSQYIQPAIYYSLSGKESSMSYRLIVQTKVLTYNILVVLHTDYVCVMLFFFTHTQHMPMIKAVECGLIIVTNQLKQLCPSPLASRYTHPDKDISQVMATSNFQIKC